MIDKQSNDNPESTIRIVAPYSLNYLVFIQNLYLNSISENKKILFPQLDISDWELRDKDKFILSFKEIWEQVYLANQTNYLYDYNGVLESDSIFMNLFNNSEVGKSGFNKSKKLFLSWWNGYIGKIAVEKLFQNEITHEIYTILLSASKNKTEGGNIILIYDKQVLVESIGTQNGLLLPL